MAKGRNGGGFKEGRKSRPAKGGEPDPTLSELQEALSRPVPPKEVLPVAVPVVAPEESPEPVANSSSSEEITAPEVFRAKHGKLADGATWSWNSPGEIVIKRIQKFGMMGDQTREVTYTSTLSEGKEILNQIERGVATSEPITQTIIPAPEVSPTAPTASVSEIVEPKVVQSAKSKPRRPREPRESFDPNKNYLSDVKEAYLGLANNLRKTGVPPENLPPEVWKSANAILEKTKKRSLEFEDKSSSDLAKYTAATEMYKAKSALTGGRISRKIEEAAQKYREEHGPVAQEPVAQNTEVEPPQVTGDTGVDTSGVAAIQQEIEENRRRAEGELNQPSVEVDPEPVEVKPPQPAPLEGPEKTPGEIAAENRYAALGVSEEFEAHEAEDIKKSYDQIHQLLRKMSEDPEVDFNAKDVDFNYRVVLPVRDEQGNLTARQEVVYTYHDLLRLRALIPEEIRQESDEFVWDWNFDGKWGKIASFADTKMLWDRLDNPDDRLSKYKNEFDSLVDGARNEQLPDEYAHAVSRGEIIPAPAQAGEKVRAPELIPIDELKAILRAQLEGNKKIKSVNDIGIAIQDNGLQLHIDINVPQGNAVLDGLVVIEEGKPVFKDRNASKYPTFGKSTVEAAFADLGAEIQKHFDAHYGQPVHIQVGEKGLSIEFAPPVTAEPATGPDVDDMSANPDDAPDEIKDALDKDATRAENRSKFFEVMKKAGEKFGWYASSSEKLIRRRDELDAQLEAIGGKLGIERGFRWMGEKYNKMPFKYKVALGATLGLGTIATAGTLAVALPLLGIAGQRAAGLSTMYLKFEKKSHDEAWGKNKEWGKQKAMLKAGVYTVLLGLTMKEAIEYASQTEAAHWAQTKVEGWLGAVMPGHESAPPSEPPKGVTAPKGIPGAPQPAPAPEASASPPASPAAAAAAGDATPAPKVVATEAAPAPASEKVPAPAASEVAAPAPEAPDISVEATKGRGYEYMMKRLWEQLHDPEKHFTPPQNLDPKSDLARLLDVKPGDEAGINKLVHDLATDNEFYKENGTNVRINIGDKMTVDAEGKIWLGEDILAPAGAQVTPVYHPEAPPPPKIGITPPPHVEAVDLTAEQDDAAKHIEPPPHEEAPAATSATPSAGEQPLAWRTGSGGELVDSSGNSVRAGVSESLPGANSFGIVVSDAVPHVYTGSGGEQIFAYGGSAAERGKVILEHLMKNPNGVVFAADEAGKYRVPWHLVEGKVTAGPPMRTNGILGLFSTYLKPPRPEEFVKVIK